MSGRQLAAVPSAPRRALALIRVSKERDDMVSPEIQRAAIVDHCERRGYVIVGEVEGIDESGSRRKSPWWARLDEAVGRIESGDVDVIVVWRFSRTARNRMRWAVAIDRVEVAGGMVESATEPLDTSTASGRLARGMLAEMAAYEAEVIGATWREVHARRTRSGKPANGKPRFGYTVQDGLHRPDPETGPVLASLYRRYVAGESFYGLVRWLNGNGYRTVPGYSKRGPGPFSEEGLRRTLDSGFGAGWITVHGERVRGIHEPVIDEALWLEYLAARASRRVLRSSERSPYLLSGMVRCMADVDGRPCGSPMSGGRWRIEKFRCIAAVAQHRHAGGQVSMNVVEDAVVEWLRVRAARFDAAAQARAGAVRAVDRRHVDAERVAREIAALDQQLTRLTVQLARDVIPQAAYVAARDEIAAQRRALEERHGRLTLSARSTADAGPLAADLMRDWPVLPVEVRRGMLRRLIARVEVTPGRPQAVVRVVPVWELRG
jgi:site-specific DNA recombinase